MSRSRRHCLREWRLNRATSILESEKGRCRHRGRLALRSDEVWDEPIQGITGDATVTTTGHRYVITYGENTGDTATDS